MAELLLIVTGVLIALSVDNCNQTRKDRLAEYQLLGEIQASVTRDLEINSPDTDLLRAVLHSATVLLRQLDSGSEYSDSLDLHFGNVLLSYTFTVNYGPYEALRARGFDLIENADLRRRIQSLYTYDYPYTGHLLDRHGDYVWEQLRPYMFTGFRIRTPRASPLSYGSLSKDPAFTNHMDISSRILRSAIQQHETTIVSGNDLVAAIGRELGRQ
jgi:hypothetical protein